MAEHVEFARSAVDRGRVVYVSNHKSHLDYLVEPLVLDDNGIRPPLLAAGINLFGGALGLLHKHVTGAVPIRRNSKDPLYLITLRAYIAELLKDARPALLRGGRAQLQRRIEVPEDRPAAGGAARLTGTRLSVVPMAVAYDLVLEDRMLSREAMRKSKRPFAQEVAEMVRHAVGIRVARVRDVRAGHSARLRSIRNRGGISSRWRTACRTTSAASTRCCPPRSWPR